MIVLLKFRVRLAFLFPARAAARDGTPAGEVSKTRKDSCMDKKICGTCMFQRMSTLQAAIIYGLGAVGMLVFSIMSLCAGAGDVLWTIFFGGSGTAYFTTLTIRNIKKVRKGAQK
jgi:hypothetical protein